MNLRTKMRVGDVTRFHIVRTHRAQTLAEHLYKTWLLVDELWTACALPEAQLSQARNWALRHDLPEILTGDMSGLNDRVMRVQQDPVRLECSFSVEPTSFESHWHGLQNVDVRLTTAAGCRWSVRSTTGWLTFSGPEEREGSDVVRVSIPVFTEDSTRRAPLEFRWESPTAGQNVWVEQGGCRYGSSESARTFTAAGAIDQPVTIVTQPVSPSCSQGCPWTATSDASWITVTSPMPRAGDDMFRYAVAVNTTGMLRQGHIRVADRVIVITQNP